MIEFLQSWLQKVYRIDLQESVRDYLIDFSELQTCLGDEAALSQAEELVLCSANETECYLALYLSPNILVEKQKVFSPHQIMTQIEGVSHWLLLQDRLREQTQTSKLEMELQAELDKFLFFCIALPPSYRRHAKDHLDQVSNLVALTMEEKENYETARQLASRYCHYLQEKYLNTHSLEPLFQELRCFYRMSPSQKFHKIGLP